MLLTYKPAGIDVRVYLGKRHTGTIKRGSEGWRYFPKGSKVGGEADHNIHNVMRSLEIDNNAKQ